ncbi:universal stress protein [Ensifer sp. ZNC0028]|uniref:universal stress protein n=1 Tax=Ensifer sp. ZNC0028 TaxID=1339236 RepID=UPI0005BAA868|nr:universal stress protein [Ensifer sp. ZNC0028]
MTYKTILAVVGVDHSAEDLRAAAQVCASANAHLSLLIVKLAASPPIGDFAAAISIDWLNERQREVDKLESCVARATDILTREGISFSVETKYTEAAWADDEIGERARYADLTLVGDGLMLDPELRSRTIDGALFNSARPVLVLPKGKPARLDPKTVVLAWNSRLEAARAVREALDLLKGAKIVHVTMVDPRSAYGKNGEEPGADIAGYLARHGVSVSVERLPSGGHRVDDVINRFASDVAADLIVMGAYGHSRMRERVFGGVTRSMLENAVVPVLMAH